MPSGQPEAYDDVIQHADNMTKTHQYPPNPGDRSA